jgi:hypothetical protein
MHGAGEIGHGADVEGLAAPGVSQQVVGEGVVSEIFEKDPAPRRVLAVQGRHVDPARCEQVAHLEKGPARSRPASSHLFGLGSIGHEHGHRGRPGQLDAEVAAR